MLKTSWTSNSTQLLENMPHEFVIYIFFLLLIVPGLCRILFCFLENLILSPDIKSNGIILRFFIKNIRFYYSEKLLYERRFSMNTAFIY